VKNIFVRSITGLLFVGAIVGSLLWKPEAFMTVFALLTILTVYEFCGLMRKEKEVKIPAKLVTLAGFLLFIALADLKIGRIPGLLFVPYLLLILFLFVRELYIKHDNPIHNWAYILFSQVYVALPFALLNILAFRFNESTQVMEYTPQWPLTIFIFIWLNDTGAYMVGSLMGKHRLFYRISPKKSWEGAIGGGIFALIAAFVLSYYYLEYNVWQWLGFAVVVVFASIWGDLIESLIKRHLGVKDSGTILPGHGGMMDRLDSALFAIPFGTIYLYLIDQVPIIWANLF